MQIELEAPGGEPAPFERHGPQVALGAEAAFAQEGGDPLRVSMFFDAETSGGLLDALPEDVAEVALARLRAAGAPCAEIVGVARPRGAAAVVVTDRVI